jgi:hypothetical protein
MSTERNRLKEEYRYEGRIGSIQFRDDCGTFSYVFRNMALVWKKRRKK